MVLVTICATATRPRRKVGLRPALSCRRRGGERMRFFSRSSPAVRDPGSLFLLAAEEIGVRALRRAADLFVRTAGLEREEEGLGLRPAQAADRVEDRSDVLGAALAGDLDQGAHRAAIAHCDQSARRPPCYGGIR